MGRDPGDRGTLGVSRCLTIFKYSIWEATYFTSGEATINKHKSKISKDLIDVFHSHFSNEILYFLLNFTISGVLRIILTSASLLDNFEKQNHL